MELFQQLEHLLPNEILYVNKHEEEEHGFELLQQQQVILQHGEFKHDELVKQHD